MDLVQRINDGLGRDRLTSLKKDPDSYQTFWIGVMKAHNTADHGRDIIPFLILKGYGEIKNNRRIENNKKYQKYCPECNKHMGFRKVVCDECGGELDLEGVLVEFSDYHPAYFNHDIDIMIEMYVDSLNGNLKHVARRWLIERIDLISNNSTELLSMEVGVSKVTISKYKKFIKQGFHEWIK